MAEANMQVGDDTPAQPDPTSDSNRDDTPAQPDPNSEDATPARKTPRTNEEDETNKTTRRNTIWQSPRRGDSHPGVSRPTASIFFGLGISPLGPPSAQKYARAEAQGPRQN